MKIRQLLFGLAIFLGFVSTVVAVGEVKQNIMEAKKEMRAGDFKEAKTDFKCAVTVKKIDNRIIFFRTRKAFRVQRYQNHKNILMTMIAKFESKGLDTTKLKSDMSIMDVKTSKISTDFESLLSKLTESKNYDCGDAQGKYKQTLEEAKALRDVVSADAKDIHDFWKSTIRVDVASLMSQMK